VLRAEGMDNLLAAARETGVRRFVAQSFASMRNARRQHGQERGRSPRPEPARAGADVAVEHEVRVDAALDRLGRFAIGLVDEVAKLWQRFCRQSGGRAT